MTHEVFISYSTADQSAAEEIRNRLEMQEIGCWMAPHDITPGEDYAQQIIHAIEATSLLVLVLSESSNQSSFVRIEVERAVAKGKVVIPFCIHQVIPSPSLEFFISNRQWVEGWVPPLAPKVDLLAQAIHKHLTSRRMPTASAGVIPAQKAVFPAADQVKSSPQADTTELVGRRHEWQLLQRFWQRTLQGQPQLVVIKGEAGIGKTRLAEELLRWVEQQGCLTARTRAYAVQGALAYTPLTELLRTQDLWSRLPKLEDLWLCEIARLLPELSEIRREIPHPAPMTDSWQRQRFLEALARAIVVDEQPVLLLLDDLQWCDQETLVWLQYLLRFAPQARLLVVGTVRSEEMDESHVLTKLLHALHRDKVLNEIELGFLSAEESALLARHLTADVTAHQAAHLYQETEGNPLFIVEMVRMGLAEPFDGQGDRHGGTLSPTVQSVIAARLAQLSPLAHKVADLASVIGRDFSFDILVQASDSTEEELVQGLDELWERKIVREHATGTYDFSHEKLREALYTRLSTSRRRILHRRIAQVLESIHAAKLEQASGQIAVHFEQGGLPERAIPAYARAARAALHIYTLAEAVAFFERGLSLIATLPSNSELLRQELDLLLELGPVLVALQGYGSIRCKEVYLRAQHITQELGESANPAIMRALAIFYIVRCDFRQSQIQGEQICALADAATGTAAQMLYVEGHYVLGVTAFWIGEFEKSRDHLARALSHYDTRHHEAHTTLYTQDPGVVCGVRFAYTLWYLGYPEQAQQRCAEALNLARSLNHPFTLAYALIFAAWLSVDCRDAAAIEVFVPEALSYCEKYGFQHWLPIALAMQGEMLAGQGHLDDGIASIRKGMHMYEVARVDIYRVYVLALLAQAYTQAGMLDQGLATLDEALASVEKYGNWWCAAELHRVKGDLLLQKGAPGYIVEMHYQQALAIARGQQARSLELRAATSLARHWHKMGNHTQARQLLAQVYSLFDEGFATLDLQEARNLLAELA